MIEVHLLASIIIVLNITKLSFVIKCYFIAKYNCINIGEILMRLFHQYQKIEPLKIFNNSFNLMVLAIVMSDNNWLSLIFDKFAKSHHYKNETTMNVMISDLNNQDNGYEHFVGEEALKLYDTKFGNKFGMDVNDNIDDKLFRVHLFTRHEKQQKTQSYYTIIDINTSYLADIVTKKLEIPNKGLLLSLCNFHTVYTMVHKNDEYIIGGIALHKEKIIGTNISNVIKKVMNNSPSIDKDMIDQPEFMNLQLYNYQKRTIQWLINREKNPKKIVYSIGDSLQLGDVYYSSEEQQIFSNDKKKSLIFSGGGLVDEVGLGKTVQIITASLLNTPRNVDFITNDKFNSKATLVLCPNHLCGQWKREISSYLKKNHSFKIISILTKPHFEKYTYLDLMSVDIIIVSFTFFNNKAFTDKWVTKFGMGNTYHRNPTFKHAIAQKTFSDMSTDLTADPFNSMEKKCPLFMLINWNRVIVDEFHEIYSNDVYSYMRNILPHIQANYRWSVTGTPFINNDSLFNVVNFLSGFKCNDGQHILSNPNIVDYLCTGCFRRNTKQNVQDEYKLPPMDEEMIWLKFSQTERMLYNAFISNPNNDKFDVYLRKLCCHPGIADEIKAKVANCKTLKDIEKIMVKHYKDAVDVQSVRINKVKRRIKKTNKLINKAIEKHQKNEEDDDDDIYADSDDEEDGVDSDEFDPYLYDDTIEPETENEMNNALDLEFKKDTKYVTLLRERLENNYKSLQNEQNVYNGKLTTYNFFNNVINKLKYIENIDDDDSNDNNRETAADTDEEEYTDEEEEEEEEICGICMCEIEEGNVGVTICGHIYCHDCLTQWIETRSSCPLCNKILKGGDMFKLSYEKKKKIITAEEKQKHDLIQEVGTKIANLIVLLKDRDQHTIIFSQWDDMLHKVGKALSENGIKNVFCQGNVYQKDKAMREFNTDDKIKVIMLSSESAASGANLTKASQVILIDPVYGTREYRKDVEHQATGRAHRLGQKNRLKVIRFLVRDTIEEEIHTKNAAEDKLHVDMFKGKEKEIEIIDK
jgi:SNF2 family DNA or RNA helicase